MEEGIDRGLWLDSSLIDPKGKKLLEQSYDVGSTVSSSSRRATRCCQATPRSTIASRTNMIF